MDIIQTSRTGTNCFSGTVWVGDHQVYAELSKNELLIIKLLAEGNSIQEIADKMFRSRRTIEGQKTQLFKKLEARNGPHLISICFRNQLIQ